MKLKAKLEYIGAFGGYCFRLSSNMVGITGNFYKTKKQAIAEAEQFAKDHNFELEWEEEGK